MFLKLAQGFRLVTPDPFSSRELGGVWAQDYCYTKQTLCSHFSGQGSYYPYAHAWTKLYNEVMSLNLWCL